MFLLIIPVHTQHSTFHPRERQRLELTQTWKAFFKMSDGSFALCWPNPAEGWGRSWATASCGLLQVSPQVTVFHPPMAALNILVLM